MAVYPKQKLNKNSATRTARMIPNALAIGHTAAGLAIHDVYAKGRSALGLWKTLALVIVLTNLPDIDVLVGLIVHGNGNFFHRGPTHSLLFALIMAFLVSNSWRCWSKIPNSKSQITMTKVSVFRFQCSGPSAFAFTP